MFVREYQLYINNEFREAADRRTFASTNPFNQETIATFARAGVPDVQAAVMAARQAFDSGSWPLMSRETRAQHIKAISDKIGRAHV